MRIKETVEIKQEITVDILCNKCGNSLNTECGYEGLVEVEILFGYESKKDGTIYRFSLCENCLEDLVSTFKLPFANTEEE